MDITARREWGAVHEAGQGVVALPVPEVWLHHSVTNVDQGVFAPADDTPEQERRAMRQLEAIGESRFGAGVSYTFAVMPSGRLYEGTGPGRLGTHTGGRNSRSHAIVLIGNYEDNHMPDAMVRAVAELLAYGKRRGWWRAARLNGGHRDLKGTACPGINAYRRIAEINELAARIEAGAITEEDIVASKEELREVVREELAPIRQQGLELKNRGDATLRILREALPALQADIDKLLAEHTDGS